MDGPSSAPAEADLMALLAGRAPADTAPRSAVDSQALLQGLMACWQILPAITDDQLTVLQSILHRPDAVRLVNLRTALIAFMRAQVVATGPFLAAMARSGLDYCLLKGSAAGRLVYPEPWRRGAWDLDIGVRRHDLAAAEAIAIASGFRAAQQDPVGGGFTRADPRLKAEVESQHYELGFLVRRLQVGNLPAQTLRALRAEPFVRAYWFDVEAARPTCYASVDIHHAISHDIPLDDLLDSRQRLACASDPCWAPSTAWIAAHLVFKLYWEGVHHYGKMLYEYADLIRLAPSLDPPAFAQLIAILTQYDLIAAGHYVFRRLPQFGVELQPHILDFVDASANVAVEDDPIRRNDLGDMWPKLWARR